MTRDVVLIAGPTASGKSAHAVDLAQQTGAAIINTDSMQVYNVLQVLTARPNEAEMGKVPHHLYGHIDPSRSYSTGQWARDVKALLQLLPDDLPLIFVGGTGLYFRALTDGLSPMPEIAPSIRAHWRERLAHDGANVLHNVLSEKDPVAAEALEPSDSQRIVRALEVLEASGKPISWWQAQPGEPLIDADNADKRVLLPERARLHDRINRRFADMTESGAVDEVKALIALDLDPALPAMRAIGVPEISQALNGELSWDEAIDRAQAATRQYAKRQMTWFRQQMDSSWQRMAI